MTAAVASPRPRPSLRVSQGAAGAILFIAGLARQDAEAVRALALEMLSVWEALDRETLHPTGNEHAHVQNH